MARPRATPPALPGLLAEVAEVTSEATALALARQAGGQDLWMPAEPGPGHRLTRIVGSLREARLIAARLGPGSVMIPSAIRYLRWVEVQILRHQGLTLHEIARTVRLSESHVQRLAARAPKGDTAVPADGRCPWCRRPPARPRRARGPDPRQMEMDFLSLDGVPDRAPTGSGCRH